ncbi:MAG: hypothetical protein ABSA86_04510 [Oryzomonas sp.]|jgi:hypothetical protein
MKRFMQISVAVMAVLMACATPGQADRFHGGGWGWGWGPALGVGLLGLGLWEASYPHYAYPYYPYAYPGPVVVQQPATEAYVQQAPQRSAESGYWYYCQNPEGYYPYVKKCPNGWMKVVPSPPP